MQKDRVKLDEQLLEVFNHYSSFKVHSIFETVINFCHDDTPFLWTVMTKQDHYPRAVLVDEQTFEQMKQTVAIGDDVTVKNGVVYYSQNSLSLTHATPYTIEKTKAYNVHELKINEFNQVATALSKYKNGFDKTIVGYLYQPNNPLEQLLTDDYEQAMTYLLGRGIGLTPTGDDMLLGALWVLTTCQLSQTHLVDRIKQTLSEKLTQAITTDISKHYLLLAIDGIFVPQLKQLELFFNDQTKVSCHELILNVLAHGHTSGYDILTGIVCTFMFLQDKNYISNN